jgi:hypothetical protein
LGGCAPDPEVTHACPACGWRGFRTAAEDAQLADLASLLKCEHLASLDELGSVLEEHTEGLVLLRQRSSDAATTDEPELELLGIGRGIGLSFPLSRAQFWADVEFLADLSLLADEDDEPDLDEAK